MQPDWLILRCAQRPIAFFVITVSILDTVQEGEQPSVSHVDINLFGTLLSFRHVCLLVNDVVIQLIVGVKWSAFVLRFRLKLSLSGPVPSSKRFVFHDCFGNSAC